MARHTPDEPADDSLGGPQWVHNHKIVFGAGAIGLILVAVLVYTVVQMSDQWSKPTNPLPTTVPTLEIDPTTRERPSLIITPTESSTSYTTSVPLSTTEIGLPPPEATSGTETSGTDTSDTETSGTETSDTETTSSEEATTTRTRTTRSNDDADGDTTTTRKRPRLNQTRTLSP